MAFIELDSKKLEHNYNYLKELLDKDDIKFGIVSKVLCGNKDFLEELINLGADQIFDSRIYNLKVVKSIDSNVETAYIRPPSKRSIRSVVRYADISFNTEFYTIRLLSEEAQRQDKTHKVIIMIEMGDLREGVMREDLINFYEKVFKLPGIEVIGLGTNLNCMHGVMPDGDKLIQLALYKQIIELRFKKEIPLVSGGTTVTIPLLMRDQLPDGVNHFRIGEALFFGKDLFTDGLIDGMSDRVMELYTQVIEISEKPVVPSGELGMNPQGKQTKVSQDDFGKTSYRAIIDIGVLDIQPDYLIPVNENIEILDASSDMLILDVGTNEKGYKVGDEIRFKLKYMGALGLMSSDYIQKRVAD